MLQKYISYFAQSKKFHQRIKFFDYYLDQKPNDLVGYLNYVLSLVIGAWDDYEDVDESWEDSEIFNISRDKLSYLYEYGNQRFSNQALFQGIVGSWISNEGFMFKLDQIYNDHGKNMGKFMMRKAVKMEPENYLFQFLSAKFGDSLYYVYLYFKYGGKGFTDLKKLYYVGDYFINIFSIEKEELNNNVETIKKNIHLDRLKKEYGVE